MSNPIMSANNLAITEAEHRALLEIRGHFAAGTFRHDVEMEADQRDGFNMEQAEKETKCGTTCCIGGWMYQAMARDRTTRSASATRYVHYDRSDALHPLFFPEDIDDMAYADITPGAALAAIDSFISSGDPDWRKALGLDVEEITA